jgi:hypothetical protein
VGGKDVRSWGTRAHPEFIVRDCGQFYGLLVQRDSQSNAVYCGEQAHVFSLGMLQDGQMDEVLQRIWAWSGSWVIDKIDCCVWSGALKQDPLGGGCCWGCLDVNPTYI